jgi:hypothetical protein
MVIEWRVREKSVKYLTVIIREVDQEGDQKINSGTVYKQILIMKINKWKMRSKNRADWEKCIKKAKVSTGL